MKAMAARQVREQVRAGGWVYRTAGEEAGEGWPAGEGAGEGWPAGGWVYVRGRQGVRGCVPGVGIYGTVGGCVPSVGIYGTIKTCKRCVRVY